MSKLVIVESPTKAKTLSKILDKSYVIEASMGHIRDLPKKGLAVDVEHNFEPSYEVPEKAQKVVNALKKKLADTDVVVLATDPDREGEAIAWHLQQILTSVKKYKTMRYERVVFHELTRDAVLEAFTHPSELNLNLVDAQQARRVLDRLVGYKLSPLLWKKVRFGLSAGRVQSVAVRLIVEKERERLAFIPEEYWTLISNLAFGVGEKKHSIKAELEKKDDKKITIDNQKDAQKAQNDLEKALYTLSAVDKIERKRQANPPFRTSTLQQAMSNLYGFTASRTMSAAQKLFEQGLITYHRTDSFNLAPQFVASARAYVKDNYGQEYLPTDPVFYKTKSKNAQEAHEAIRPTDVFLHPSKLKKTIAEDARKVYVTVWRRALECQMAPAIYDQTTFKITTNNNYGLKTTGSIIKFSGWMAIGEKLGLKMSGDDVALPDIKEGSALDLVSVESTQHFTQPPARYSDATLIKKMEELGIGRPSTYAPTLSTIQRRGYVEKEGKYYKPKPVALVVTDLLVGNFPNIAGYDFTAEMENELDLIAEGEKKWVPVVKAFYEPFEKQVEEKDKTLSKHDITNLGETDEKCPECGKTLIIKLGKFGTFLSCSGYPECEYARPIEGSSSENENGETVDYGKCTVCEDGIFVLKQGRFGKFLACSNYPKCKTTKPFLEKIGMHCPDCSDGEVIVKKAKGRSFYGCSNYPECKYASWKNPLQKDAKDRSTQDSSLVEIESDVAVDESEES